MDVDRLFEWISGFAIGAQGSFQGLETNGGFRPILGLVGLPRKVRENIHAVAIAGKGSQVVFKNLIGGKRVFFEELPTNGKQGGRSVGVGGKAFAQIFGHHQRLFAVVDPTPADPEVAQAIDGFSGLRGIVERVEDRLGRGGIFPLRGQARTQLKLAGHKGGAVVSEINPYLLALAFNERPGGLGLSLRGGAPRAVAIFNVDIVEMLQRFGGRFEFSGFFVFNAVGFTQEIAASRNGADGRHRQLARRKVAFDILEQLGLIQQDGAGTAPVAIEQQQAAPRNDRIAKPQIHRTELHIGAERKHLRLEFFPGRCR